MLRRQRKNISLLEDRRDKKKEGNATFGIMPGYIALIMIMVITQFKKKQFFIAIDSKKFGNYIVLICYGDTIG